MSGVIYPINDKKYTAEDVEIFNCTRTSGVYSVLDFDCALNGNIVTVGKGLAWIKNSDFSGKAIAFKEEETITLDSADDTLDRYDVIAVRYDATKKEPELVVIKGEPNSVPVLPDRSTKSYLYELFLYSILRKAGEGTVLHNNLNDLRENENYCGIMRDSVTSATAPIYETKFEGASFVEGAEVPVKYNEEYEFFIATASINLFDISMTLNRSNVGTKTLLSGEGYISVASNETDSLYVRCQISIEQGEKTGIIDVLKMSYDPTFSNASSSNITLSKLVGVTKQPEGYVKVDSVYNPESPNAQSGEAVKKAIDKALKNFEGGNVEIPENIETTNNKVSVIDENSTDTQYPSAKAVYEFSKVYVSPNGMKWNISVDNNGNIVTTKISDDIPATGISLSANTLTFNSSANKTLTATLIPSNSTDIVVWTSNNESVAVVSDGVITPISNGSATITATAGAVSASCEITVNIESEEVVTYTITRNITNAIGFDNATVIGEGSELLECYISDDECTMNGATATVTMGGEDITDTAYNNGVVNIENVTGDVVITLNAVKINFVVPPITDFTYEVYENTKLKVTSYNGTEKAIELPVTAEIDGTTYSFRPYGLSLSSSVEHLKVPEDVTYLISSMKTIKGGGSTLKTADIYSDDIRLAEIAHTALEKALKLKDVDTAIPKIYLGNTEIRTLENVTYPTGITSLHSSYGGLYSGMTGLIYGGTIPSHITTLTRAFYGCSNMRKIRVETTAEGTSTTSNGAYYQTFYNVQELDIELYVSGGLWNCLRSAPLLKWNYKGIDENIDRVVCFGDSLTAATYPTELLNLLPQNVTTHNCGQGGYTSEQIYQRMIEDPYCRRLKDDIIVIWHGTNGYGTDGYDGVTAKMIEALEGNERYVLIPPTNQGEGDDVYESWVTTYGAEHVLSIGDWFEANGYTVADYLTDGTHFTEEGYALIAQAVYEKIQQYL